MRYVYGASERSRLPMSGPAILSPDQFRSLTPQQRKLRRLQWLAIIDDLRVDHYRRYHLPRHAAALRRELLDRETR